MTDQPSRDDTDATVATDAPRRDASAGGAATVLQPLTADPMALASAVLGVLGVLLLLVGVAGSWHWRAAVLAAVLAAAAALGLVVVSATRRPAEVTDLDKADESPVDGALSDEAHEQALARTARPIRASGPVTAEVRDAAATEPVPPRPRFAGFGKPKPASAPLVPPPPQPSNVQVMHPQGGHVRVTPPPVAASRPDRSAGRPPSTPPATPPTIQVGAPRDPGFRTYQPADAAAPVIQVRNRYHRPDCRYVTVADDAVQTTLGEARATNAMPCGVCRP